MSKDYVDDDYIFDTQWLAMKRCLEGNGIFSGLAVTPGTGMKVDLADGVFYAAKTRRVLTGGPTNINIDASDGTFDRWDIITGKDSGSPVFLYTAGVAAAAPKPADLPADHILISMVYVPATITQILASHINDFGFITSLLEHASRHGNGGGDSINVTALSGLLTDDQHVLDAEVLLVAAALIHAIRHENGGADEINVDNLSGLLTDPQNNLTAATDTIRNSNDTEKSTTDSGGGPGTKIKEILLNADLNEARIHFELKRSAGSGLALARIHKNGAIYGTLRNTASTTYVSFDEDLGPLLSGDLIQIYAYVSVGGNTAYVKNMRFNYDPKIIRSVTNQDP